MNEELTKIWEMIGALSDAHWRRAAQPGASAYRVLFEEPYRPESEEERAIWAELTAPRNCLSLRRYIETSRISGANEFARAIYDGLLADASSLWSQSERPGKAS